MVILRKLDAAHLSIEAYEQYGMHPSPNVYVTCDWANKEDAIESHNANVVARMWAQVQANAGR